MGQRIPFGPRPPQNRGPQKIADKLQVLLLIWPEAGQAVERFIDELLTEFGRRGDTK